ncbi:uncharacterized protein AB675_1628 [Cyphellophora attinorum]|uniref:Beta-lactamase-related domain-containing protein n=1 Tax=Cyphellophora attinorum TaxID=1664694 RepID=A0A0N1H3F3_9EURO|nr:uncharacterized protein AB675_1628 [Phialophora attinorum]KPI36095.1 hypothetical protein AB675_1628 [Phialophora attinorum]
MGPSQDNNAEAYLDASFRTWLEKLMRKHHVPGFSVAVVSQGQIHADGYGLALLPDVKAKGDTLFPMCSTTKSFTCALLGILIAEAQSKTPSSKTYPGLDVLKDRGWQTPVTQILPQASSPHPSS